ncbi:hypothetical protein M5X11_02545 [Paenibacillus alginolyticus]|uniref:hypothetical protein n=1 Tax=Paenibacillus alginolyticus TaxID=59839 RepID=UPI000FD6E0AC|nr:hypothetical protein [Paenibacillus alginolyticus]MCY9663866.1 hypothetical protein [Paenibacillus alginolyticus]
MLLAAGCTVAAAGVAVAAATGGALTPAVGVEDGATTTVLTGVAGAPPHPATINIIPTMAA